MDKFSFENASRINYYDILFHIYYLILNFLEMSERKFKVARWVNPPFVLVRWEKERPGLSFGILKFKPDMNNKIYNY